MISSTYAKPADTNSATPDCTTTWKKQLGDLGETSACQLLASKDWLILERKWRAGRIGEIDIVARSPGSQLVAVEVKTRCRNPNFPLDWQSTAFAAINSRKKKKLKAMAAIYANFRQAEQAVRIDCILVDYPLSSASFKKLLSAGKLEELPLPNFVHVENAVESQQ